MVHHLLEHCALHTVAFTCGFQCSSQQHHHQPVDSAWPEPASPVARHPGSSHISSSTLGTSSSAAQSYGSALAIRYARASIRIAMYYGIMPKLWMMHSSWSPSALAVVSALLVVAVVGYLPLLDRRLLAAAPQRQRVSGVAVLSLYGA